MIRNILIFFLLFLLVQCETDSSDSKSTYEIIVKSDDKKVENVCEDSLVITFIGGFEDSDTKFFKNDVLLFEKSVTANRVTGFGDEFLINETNDQDIFTVQINDSIRHSFKFQNRCYLKVILDVSQKKLFLYYTDVPVLSE